MSDSMWHHELWPTRLLCPWDFSRPRILEWVAIPFSREPSRHRDLTRVSCSAWDMGSIPGSERCSGEGNGYPLQYSCLENSMNRGALRATVHGVAKSQDRTEQLNNNNLLCVGVTEILPLVCQPWPPTCGLPRAASSLFLQIKQRT